MTPDLVIQQAIVISDLRGARVIAQSEGFDPAEGERIAVLFGQRSNGVACPLAHFACPMGTNRVAIVRVEDRPGPGDTLGFRFLVLSQELYQHLGDPFAISDRYPPNWYLTGSMPELAWPEELLPARILEELDTILKSGEGDLLLGTTQALVDGNRVLLQREGPDEGFARAVWKLLPEKNRIHLWPASFAFADELGLHLAILPPGRQAWTKTGPLPEEAVRNYPAGHYELNLQIAIESGDRAGLSRLLSRRTSDETIRLGLYILLGMAVLAVVFRYAL